MDRQLERCCGLDVHKDTIAACVRIGGPSGGAAQYVQRGARLLQFSLDPHRVCERAGRKFDPATVVKHERGQ